MRMRLALARDRAQNGDMSQWDGEREEKKILRLALKLNRSINRAVIVMYV